MSRISALRNDDFGNKRSSVKTVRISPSRERQVFQEMKGHYHRFAQMVPNQLALAAGPAKFNPKLNLLKAPEVSDAYEELVNRASLLADSFRKARDAEGLVFINGRRIPGIFDGFDIGGGVEIQKLDQRKVRSKLKGLKEGSVLYAVDKGIKPFNGSARFIMLDDLFSSSLDKAKEFVAIITNWKKGPKDLKITERVFKIESFLIGTGKPYDFSAIKITDYDTSMPKNMEGRMDCSFSFKQFQVFKYEKRLHEVDSTVSGGGETEPEMTVDENPVLQEFDTETIQ